MVSGTLAMRPVLTLTPRTVPTPRCFEWTSISSWKGNEQQTSMLQMKMLSGAGEWRIESRTAGQLCDPGVRGRLTVVEATSGAQWSVLAEVATVSTARAYSSAWVLVVGPIRRTPPQATSRTRLT